MMRIRPLTRRSSKLRAEAARTSGSLGSRWQAAGRHNRLLTEEMKSPRHEIGGICPLCASLTLRHHERSAAGNGVDESLILEDPDRPADRPDDKAGLLGQFHDRRQQRSYLPGLDALA